MRRQISIGEFQHMEVDDDDGRLYWKGKSVVTRQEVGLEGPTFFLAALATGATVIAAVWPIAVHLKWI
jgi:hypothetical protein